MVGSSGRISKAPEWTRAYLLLPLKCGSNSSNVVVTLKCDSNCATSEILKKLCLFSFHLYQVTKNHWVTVLCKWASLE